MVLDVLEELSQKKRRALKETPSNAIGKLSTVFKKHSKVEL